jgi:hypothetical protein
MPYIRQIAAGGVVNVPGKETELRGPQLLAAQGERNQAMDAAVQAVSERAQQTAAGDYAVALEQERRAGIQEDAANYTAAQRAEEMAQRQADFDQSARAMGEAGTLDPTRFFANANTGSKLAMMVGLLVGGLAEAKGAKNTGAEAIKRIADQDLKAQEFAYMAARDQTSAKQTAFSLAMQKYQNLDAARAAARAASLDYINAQLAKQSALWKGTDAQNRATLASAQLADERMQQIAQGVAYTAPRQVQVGPQYIDARTGLPYTQAEVKTMQAKADDRAMTNEDKANQLAGETASKVIVEGAKAQADQAKDERPLMVQLPNGDTVRAPSSAEADKLRKTSAAANETAALVAEAKAIRSDSAWRATPDKRARLEQIQADLKVAYKNWAELGALSKDDYTLAMEGTADLFSVTPGVEARLDRINEKSQRSIRNMVKTYPDAPGSAKGQMPGSFTPHGKK